MNRRAFFLSLSALALPIAAKADPYAGWTVGVSPAGKIGDETWTSWAWTNGGWVVKDRGELLQAMSFGLLP